MEPEEENEEVHPAPLTVATLTVELIVCGCGEQHVIWDVDNPEALPLLLLLGVLESIKEDVHDFTRAPMVLE